MEFFAYISKSAGILTLFYVVYILVLRKETFFHANRTYFIVGILAALLLPFVTFTSTTFVDAPLLSSSEPFSQVVPIETTVASPAGTSITIWQMLLGVYLLGCGVLLARFFIQLVSICRMLRKHRSKKIGQYRFIEIDHKVAPFSFFNYIVFNPKTHNAQELDMIIRHEKVHARQWHSIDILLANCMRALQWANPVSWYYKKVMEVNLEYMADDLTASKVPSKIDYQLALLKASSPLAVPALTNNFYHSFTRLSVFGKSVKLDFQKGQVKKRIIMLNKSNSNKYSPIKLMLVLPALALFLWSFNTKEEIRYTTPTMASEISTPTSALMPTFSATSTEADLNTLEAYFMENHPESLVKISNRKRNKNGILTKFSFQTKFSGNDRFYTRFDRGSDLPFETVYTIQPQDNGTLLVRELGEKGVQFTISKEQLVVTTLEIDKGNLTKNVVATDTANLNEPQFGDNPLYIVNGKDYRKNTLPEDQTITLDGSVEAFNKNEGSKKYGDKGKDGVLLFNGVATFVPNETKTPEAENKSREREDRNQNLAINTELPSVTLEPEIRIKITKDTTKEELDDFKKELKELHNIDFNYSNLSYNSKGEMTSITITYSGQGKNGTYSVIGDDGEAIDDVYFYIDPENNKSGFASTRSKEMLAKREALRAQRDKLRARSHADRREAMERRRAALAEARQDMNEERKGLREELAAVRKSEMKAARAVSRARSLARGNAATAIVITKNMTDAELEALKSELSEQGITFNYKRVKRNSRGEITSIKATFDNGRGNKVSKAIQSDDDEPINTIVVDMM